VKSRRVGDLIIVRFDVGERYPDAWIQLAHEYNLTCGFVTAIGAIENVKLAYYDLDLRAYLPIDVSGIVELVSFSGSLTLLNGAPLWHVHAIVGDRDGNLRGGHLTACEVAITVECQITVVDTALHRIPDPRTGLNFINV
jgi:predicted DNA-binding protein with PD1-like motif